MAEDTEEEEEQEQQQEGDCIAGRMRLTQSMRDEEKYTEKVWKEIEAEEKEMDYDG